MPKKIHLPTTFNHDECQNIYNDCQKILETENELIFNASSVERMGTSGVQILLSAGLFCKKNKKKCLVEAPSQFLLEALEQVGCLNIFKELGMMS